MNRWEWVNTKDPEEWATIALTRSGLVQLLYGSKYGKLYSNYFRTVQGAKASLSRYVGYKTEWELK